MRVTSFVALSLGVLPALVSAGLFSEGGPVKMLQDKVFRRSLKSEVCHALSVCDGDCAVLTNVGRVFVQRTAVVAFVAPWCGVSQSLFRALSIYCVSRAPQQMP
jgi:hypothetical protein